MQRRTFLASTLVGGLVAGTSLLGTSLFGSACSEEAAPENERQKILESLANSVFYPTYQDCATSCQTLAKQLEAFQSSPTESSLQNAQQAWKAARIPWKQASAFNFGPADDLAITGGTLNSLPIDSAALEALASGTDTLDAAKIETLGANQRGYHAVEYLLFSLGTAGSLSVVEKLTTLPQSPRMQQLLVLLAKDLSAKLDAIAQAWSPSGGNYAGELAKSGRGGTAFSGERQAIDAVVNGMITGAELVASVRLGKPLGVTLMPNVVNPELEECHFSDTSIEDISEALRGLQIVYTGERDSKPQYSIQRTVNELNAAANDSFVQSLETAMKAVKDIPAPLRTSLTEKTATVTAALEAVRAMKKVLTTSIAGALGTTIGFNETDGD
jgi:predicted lipoprotein